MKRTCLVRHAFSAFPAILIVLAVCFLYSDVYKFHFQMEWDDYWVVINEYTSRGIRPDNLIAVFTEFYHGQYSPVNELYYIAIHSLAGYKAVYFHLFSVFIHAINCLLLQRLLFRIAFHGLGMALERSRSTAWIAVLIFAVHPLNVEAVAWISASKIPLYAMFYFMSLLLYVNYLISRKKRYIFFSVFLFLLSFGSKEQAVVYPLCVILLDYTFGFNVKNLSNLSKYLSLFFLSILLGIVTIMSQGSEEQMGSSYSIIERILLAFYSLAMYFTQSVVPVKLSYLYPFPFEHGEVTPFHLYLYPVLLTAIIYAGRKLILKKEIFFPVMFFLIHLAVALHIVGLGRFSVTADRYAYVSLAGFSFIAGFLFTGYFPNGARTYNFRLKPYWFYVLALGLYSNVSLQAWRDSATLKSTIRTEIRARKDYRELEKRFDQL